MDPTYVLFPLVKITQVLCQQKTHALAFLERQLCAMLTGTVIEVPYGGPWLGWG